MSITRSTVFDPGEAGRNTRQHARHSLVRKAASALGVAALGVAATAAGLTYSTPAAHAAGPAVYKVLGGNTKNDSTNSNSEFRGDFIVSAPTGTTIKTIKYSHEPQATAVAAQGAVDYTPTKMTTSSAYESNQGQVYIIQQQVDASGTTYFAISVKGDANYNGAGSLFYAVEVTFSDDSVVYADFPTTLVDPDSAPVMPTTWDNTWSVSGATSEENFGMNVGTDPSSAAATGTANKIIIDTRYDGSTPVTCDSQKYQWFDVNDKAVGSVQTADIPSHSSGHGSLTATPPTALLLGEQPAFPGPGYYKMLGWPCGTDAGDAKAGWQIASVFNDVLPNPPVPTITAPADGTTITKKSGSPIKLTGTLPARTDQRGYAATDKVAVTDADGNKVCDATVTAAAAGKASTWTCDATLKDGSYTITATYTQVTDAPSGLSNIQSAASAPVSFDVDRTAVAPATITPKDGTKLQTSPMEISGTATDALNPPGTVTVMDGKTVLCKDIPVAEDGSWTCVLNDPLSVGKHTISVTYTDGVGNVSPATTATYEVLTPAPGPTVTVQGTAGPTTVTTSPSAGAVVLPSTGPSPEEPLAFTGASLTGPLVLGGSLAALGAIAYILARRARAHRKALTA